MSHVAANLYMYGSKGSIEETFVKFKDKTTCRIVKATKSRNNLYYIEFPTFLFSLSSLSTDLEEYIDRYKLELLVVRTHDIKDCILSIRGRGPDRKTVVGFYISGKTLRLLASLSISLDFDPDFFANDLPRWSG